MIETESYGDLISTVTPEGKRKWIYALQPKGKIYDYRKYVTAAFLVFFFAMPFIKINGYPALMFNIPKGIFVILGQVFFPQDFIYLGMVMLTVLLFIIVFTLVFGRVFCGWVCPQTIFMEMVFRRIEYWIEGPAHIQIKNDKKKTPKIWIRKIIKHIIFLLISFIIANTFLAYIIGTEELFTIMREPVSEHLVGFIAIATFTLVFYSVYAYVRELVCTVVCPYGRLQSVLMDENSIAVAYDYNRGEPRNKKRRVPEGEPEPGDCIDCNLCVMVCPTGIDIRDGLQMECVNCTACIDACNMMMDKVGKEPNLITFASEAQLKKNEKTIKLNYRAKSYIAVLIVLVTAMSFMLFSRPVIDATVIRVPGQIYQENKDGTISNLYRIELLSKSMKNLPYELKLVEENTLLQYVGNPGDTLFTGIHASETFFIKIPAEEVITRKLNLHLQILSDGEVIQTKKVSFVGPFK